MKRLQSFLVFSDLWPYDLGDRAYKALVLAALVGLTIVFSKHLSLPETALSAYLILFAVRPGAFETIAIAVALMCAALLAVGLHPKRQESDLLCPDASRKPKVPLDLEP